MVKIGSNLIQYLLAKSTSSERFCIKDSEFQIHASPLFGEPYCSHQVRTLKAVYSHFAEAKRKIKYSQNSSNEALTGNELKLAMKEAKSNYEAMRDIQDQLNDVYNELIFFKSK